MKQFTVVKFNHVARVITFPLSRNNSGFATTSAPTLFGNSGIAINLSRFFIPSARREPIVAARREPISAARRDPISAARRDPITAARRDPISAARRTALCSLFLKFGMFPAYALRMAL